MSLPIGGNPLGSRTALVTGGAGFIGSHLVDRLVAGGWEVRVIDNLSSGRLDRIKPHISDRRIEFLKGDLSDRKAAGSAVEGCEHVFHVAADPVVRGGFSDVARRYSPIRNNILATQVLLEAMIDQAKAIAFSSSSVVYGRATVVPTPEGYGPLKPISLYGASKLAGEGLITAYSEGFGYDYWIFRFANVVGARSSQGVVNDFVWKLGDDPHRLQILGDGKQMKCYLHVSDCVEAMIHCIQNSCREVFNLGTHTPVEVEAVARFVEQELGLEEVVHTYTGGEGGWTGDLQRTFLDVSKITSLGWKPRMDSEEALRRAVRELVSG